MDLTREQNFFEARGGVGTRIEIVDTHIFHTPPRIMDIHQWHGATIVDIQ
jgi:hypothetical protein